MDKQGSVKKIQKVQRAGVSRAAGQRRELGFPLAVVAIIVIGTLLTFMAREAYRGNVGRGRRRRRRRAFEVGGQHRLEVVGYLD